MRKKDIEGKEKRKKERERELVLQFTSPPVISFNLEIEITFFLSTLCLFTIQVDSPCNLT